MAPLMVRTMPLALLLLLATATATATAAVSVRPAGEEGEDPEVTACRQQCVRQWQFGPAERRYCLRQCDEYGRAKRQQQQEEGAERERDRCLHECRVGPPKPGCERRCQEAYERATRGGGDGGSGGGPREVAAVAGRMLFGRRRGRPEAATERVAVA